MRKKSFIPLCLLFNCLSTFGQTELIQNGNFSNLGSNWSILGPYWFISNSFTCYSSATAYAYTGTVGGNGANNTYGSINQAITIPANATSATLTFKTSINTDETTTTTIYDLLDVQLRTPSLALLHTFVQYSNLNGASGSSGCQPYQLRTFNVPSIFFGQPLLLNFQTTSDAASFTKFRIDDVSLTYQACTVPPAPTGLTATVVSATQINLSWNSVSGATDYEVDYGIGNCPWGAGGINLTTTHCNTCTNATATGLAPNTTYRFIVLAKNSCGWGTTFNCVTATTNGSCSYSVSPSSVSPSSSAGNGSVSVTASSGCNWTAISNNTSWLTVTSGSSGTGNGTVNYSYTSNGSANPRTGTITVAGQTFTVTQAGTGGCNYSISPSSVSPSTSAGNGSVSVTVSAGCNWTAVSNNTSWLDVISGSSGTGNGTVNYSYTSNGSSSPRTGTITAAGQIFTVMQAGNALVPTVNSFTGTNVILNHTGIEPTFSFYYDNTPYSNNAPIKVCADGTTATYFKISVASDPANFGFQILKYNQQAATGADADTIGLLGTPYVFNGNNIEIPYTSPKYMESTGSHRTLTLKITYSGTPINTISFPLEIYRAPVFFVHGLWGDKESFQGDIFSYLRQSMYPYFPSENRLAKKAPLFYFGDYSSNENFKAAGYFAYYNQFIRLENIKFFTQLRENSFSCSSIDFLCHSMGGIVTRKYLQGPNYRNDIHKLITLATPHMGTQTANFLLSPEGRATRSYFNHGGGFDLESPFIPKLPCYLGSVEDLRVNSSAIQSLNTSPNLNRNVVPTHAIIGTDVAAFCSSIVNCPPYKEDNFIVSVAYRDYKDATNSNISITEFMDTIFNDEVNDLTVPYQSQHNGVATFSHYSGFSHTEIRKEPSIEILSKLRDLLNSRPNDPVLFSLGYNPGGFLTSSFQLDSEPFNNRTESYSLTMEILNVGNIFSNDSIHVKVVGASNLDKINLTAGSYIHPVGYIATTNNDSTVFSIPLANAMDGTIFIMAQGYDSTSYVVETHRFLNVLPAATLDSIQSDFDSLTIWKDESKRLYLKGFYSDGIDRDLFSTMGVLFNVADTNIFTLDSSFSVHPKTTGQSSITFTYQGKIEVVTITIVNGPAIYPSMFEADKYELCNGGLVQFTNLTFGSPVSYSWSFTGGNPSSSTEKDPLVLYNMPGKYNVTLISTFASGSDTISVDSLIEVKVPNMTIQSGNWNNPSTWSCNTIPSANDSAIIASGHEVTLNNSTQVRKLTIENGASLSLNDSTIIFTIGVDSNKTSPVISNGSLNIKKGSLKIYGNLTMANTGYFNMTGGKLIIDGNTGQESTSIPNGQHLFNIDPAASFSFKEGMLQIINPPWGTNSQSINCPHNFGLLSTVVFGDGVSTIASNNPNGFGGDLLPPQIGKFVFDPATQDSNRIFRNLNPLIANKDIQILSGNFAPGVLFHAIDSIPSVTDVDGNSYPIITICDQEWLGKNLAVSHYRNGDTIPQVQDPAAWAALTTGAWCYYQNNTANGPVYGKLYNWYAVNDPRGIAPMGWHVSTESDWLILADSCLGGASIAGGKIKTTGTISANTGLWNGTVNTSTNSSGFSGVPSGYRLPTGVFSLLGDAAFWWTSAASSSTNAKFREADMGTDELANGNYNKKLGIAVRCVKD